jgi:hypothetical protein
VISILIPAYNAAPYLPTALDSLLSQDVDIEIVICNDGSTDETAAVAQRYASRDTRIALLTQCNAGAAAARNRAFARSSGDWVMFFDADDYLAPGSLKAMLAIATRHRGDGVYSDWTKFVQCPAQRNERLPTPHNSSMPGWLWLELAFQFDEPTYPGRFLLPRRRVLAGGGWDQRLGFQDDMEFFARMLARLPTMHYCPEALFCYRQDVADSLSKTAGRRSSESQLLATRLAVGYLVSAVDTAGTRKAAARQLMLVAYAQFLTAPDVSRQAEMLASQISGRSQNNPWLRGGSARRLLQLLFGWKLAIKLHARLRRLIDVRSLIAVCITGLRGK